MLKASKYEASHKIRFLRVVVDYNVARMQVYSCLLYTSGLAQLARAPALHAGGQRFESVILHSVLIKMCIRDRHTTIGVADEECKVMDGNL